MGAGTLQERLPRLGGGLLPRAAASAGQPAPAGHHAGRCTEPDPGSHVSGLARHATSCSQRWAGSLPGVPPLGPEPGEAELRQHAPRSPSPFLSCFTATPLWETSLCAAHRCIWQLLLAAHAEGWPAPQDAPDQFKQQLLSVPVLKQLVPAALTNHAAPGQRAADLIRAVLQSAAGMSLDAGMHGLLVALLV